MSDGVWKRVPVDRLRHVWRCPECLMTSTVKPEDYADIGTPMCGNCDCDLDYVRTEILVKPKKKDSAPQTSERPIQLE